MVTNQLPSGIRTFLKSSYLLVNTENLKNILSKVLHARIFITWKNLVLKISNNDNFYFTEPFRTIKLE